MSNSPDLDHLYDMAEQLMRDDQERQHEAEWALAEAARCGTACRPFALEILQRECGVRA
jgi:hypothetical protein